MVKFGHDLEQAQACFGEGFEYELYNYKQLKKFLKFARTWSSDDSSPDDECHSEIGKTDNIKVAAKFKLCSPFWEWTDDTEQDTEFRVEEWIDDVFITQFHRESRRVRKNIDLQVERLQAYCERVQELKRDVTSNPEARMREMMTLQDSMARLQTNMTTYISLNYTACFKILKKRDKMFPSTRLMSSLMPCVCADLGEILSKDNFENTENQIELLSSKLSPSRSIVFEKLASLQKRLQLELSDEPELVNFDSVSASRAPTLHVDIFPFMQIVRSSDYGWQGLRSDVMSAIVVSVAGIPKAMSYAALCGLPFAQGIPTLYVPCLVYFLFGSSRQGCMSPLSVPCLMLAEMLDQALGETQLEAAELMSERMRLALVYTALTGLVIFCFGVLQLGFLLHFVPKPVLSGFVSASAFIAALAALKGLLKIHVEKSQVLYVLAGNVYEALPETHLPTAVMSVLSITMLVFLPMLQKRIVKKTTGSNAFCSRVMNKACRLPTILLLVASGLLFGATLCDFAPLTPWAPKHIVLGRGATLPALVLQEAAEQFNCSFSDERVGAIYTATGSKDGIDAITSDDLKADFAISDIEPSPEVMKQHGLSSIPITSSAICPVINLPLLDNHGNAEFILDLPTVADIFEGRITHWTDRRIRSLNPNLRWYAAPDDIPIVVVSRSDASGTTFSFANMLKNCSTCNSSISPGFEVAWGAPVQASQVGTSGVVRAVAEIDWSIGYAGLAAVEDGQTTHPESPIRCAALRTSTGVVSAALDSVSSVNGQHGAWPLTVYSYMLIPSVGLLAKSSFPRVGSCEARSFLKSFTKEFFTLEASSTARGTNILQAPLLDHIECKSNATAGNAKGRNLRSEAAQGFLSPQNRPVGVASILSDASLRRLKDDECSKRSFLCGTFKVVGFIEVSLPAPNWLFGQDGATEVPVSEMLMGAFLLAIVTLLEHVANVKLYSDRKDYQVSTSGDLMALGLSNIVGSMFGSFLVAAGFSRSALNANAKSQLALALSTAISFGIVFLMAPLLSMLPDFILNAILFVAVISLVDYRMVKELFRLRGVGGEFDLVALCIAFVATCCLGVVMGMMISIAFSLVTFIFNASYPRILELRRRLGETNYCAIELPSTGCLPMSSNQDKTPGEPTDIAQERIKVLRFEAPMWFANVHHLTDRVLVELKANAAKPLHSQWNAIVLDMSTVPWLDASAGMALKKLVTVAKTYNTDVLFACVAENAQGMIRANCDGHWCDQCYTTIYDAAAACHESKPIGRAQSQERML